MKSSVQAFLDRIKHDHAFRAEVASCKNAEERLALTRREGFNFTSEQMKQAAEELSEEQLTEITGGAFYYCNPFDDSVA